MSAFFVGVMIISLLAIPVCFAVFLVKKLLKRPTMKAKRALIGSVVCFLLSTSFGIMTDPQTSCEHEYTLTESRAATCVADGYEKYHCNLCGKNRTDTVEKLGHDMMDDHRTNPTEDADGEYVKKCSRCGYEEVEILKKLEKPVESSESDETESATEDSHEVSDGGQMVLAQIAEDAAKQVAQNSSTVKMSIFSQGFYKDGHTYAVQSDFTCSNLMGVKESHTIKVVAVSNEDESKIFPTEVYLDGALIWVRED